MAPGLKTRAVVSCITKTILIIILFASLCHCYATCTGTAASPCHCCDVNAMHYTITAPSGGGTSGPTSMSYSSSSGTCGTTPDVTETWTHALGYTFCPTEGQYTVTVTATSAGGTQTCASYTDETSDPFNLYYVNWDNDQNWCGCKGGTWLSSATYCGSLGCSGGKCCGDDAGEYFEQTEATDAQCCLNATVKNTNQSVGSVLCYNGQVYDCNNATAATDAFETVKSTRDKVGPVCCLANNTWGLCPPVLNEIQCAINTNDNWTDCSNALWNKVIKRVRVNCTDLDGYVTNATFLLENVPDSHVFFNVTNATTTSGDWWIYDNTDITVQDSGDWNLSVSCIDNDSLRTDNYTNWTVPWGHLEPYLIYPLVVGETKKVEKNKFFKFKSGVTCVGGECGSVNATLDPIGVDKSKLYSNENPFEITNNNSDSIMKCSEYYNKLISEGWKVVEQDETDAILEKDGIRKHVYLLADTHTYIVDDVDSQAYRSCTGFDNNNIEFTSDQYNAIDEDDNNYAGTTCSYDAGGSGTRSEYTYNKFVTTIDENIDDISQIDILSKGYGYWYAAGMRYRYELWVKESGTWKQKDSHSSSGKDTVSISYTSGFSDIISAGKINWGLRSGGWIGTGSADIRIYAYYGEVVVTYCYSDGNSCTADSDCCNYCDTNDIDKCFSCTSCSGVTRCSNQEANECEAQCTGTSPECDDVGVDTCPSQGYICADCTYQDRDNAEAYCTDSTGCTAYTWLGSKCCGDDAGEDYNNTGTGNSCCYDGAPLNSGSSSSSILCYNGELYDCNSQVVIDGDIDYEKTTGDIVGGYSCTASNIWVSPKSGAVSTTPGDTPFYTASSNPQSYNDASCLADMKAGDSCNLIWYVNATGDIGTTWEFYVQYDPTTYSSYVGGNETGKINITIVSFVWVNPVSFQLKYNIEGIENDTIVVNDQSQSGSSGTFTEWDISKYYVCSYDTSTGATSGLVFNGGEFYYIEFFKTSSDYTIKLVQDLDRNRFVIPATKGTCTAIGANIITTEQDVPIRRPFSYPGAEKYYPVLITLEYPGIDIVGNKRFGPGLIDLGLEKQITGGEEQITVK